MINPVSPSSISAYKPDSDNTKGSQKKAEKCSSCEPAYNLTLSSESREKISKGLSSEEVERLKEEADRASAPLRDLVEKLITKQGDSSWNISVSLEITGSFNVDMTQTEAAAAIEEDGEWGVEAVSDRIVDFAKAISGGDTSKLETLREAIDKGFAMAKNTLGGTLPDISSKTYDAVMKKLDDWANETGNATEE